MLSELTNYRLFAFASFVTPGPSPNLRAQPRLGVVQPRAVRQLRAVASKGNFRRALALSDLGDGTAKKYRPRVRKPTHAALTRRREDRAGKEAWS
jgi:hypothetical protein